MLCFIWATITLIFVYKYLMAALLLLSLYFNFYVYRLA